MASHASGPSKGSRSAKRVCAGAFRPLGFPPREATTQTRLTQQDAYVFWIVGLVLLCVTLLQAAARSGGPKFRLPRPTGAHLSTALAWLIIIAVAAVVALGRAHR